MRCSRGALTFRTWWVFGWALALGLAGSTSLPGQENVRSVLVLASGDSQSRLEAEQIESLREELPPDTGLTIDYLDVKRINGLPHYLEYYSTLFYGKYQHRNLSAVVALNDDAIRVANHYRNQVFDGVPLVVCGSKASIMNELEDHGSWTGVFCEPNMEETIELALNLHPKASAVHVVTDRTLPGRQARQRLAHDKELGRFPVPVEIPGMEQTFWSLPLVLEYVGKLSAESIVFFAGYYDDRKGGIHPTQFMVPKLSQASKAPIYTMQRDAVGAGAVGGHVVNGRKTGKAVGERVCRAMNKEPLGSIAPMELEGEWLFDYAQLKRWGVDERALPKGSQIINRPVSFWGRNWQVICIGGSIALAEMAIIVQLLVARRRERRAQAALMESESRMQGLELEISERERQALGHDIHDGLGQYLTALRFQCHRLEQGVADRLPTDADATAKLAQIAESLAGEIRSLARSQVPLQMVTRSLETGLGELADSNRRLFNLETTLEMALDEKRLRDGAGPHLYRIAQEATRNAFRHAGATKARMVLREADGGGGELIVENDGEPFEALPGRRTGMGLAIMEQRARMIGATLEIRPAEDGQTRLRCRFPLEPLVT